uniref:ATP-dependent DNA helicase n=1 Tax=Dermatophagoides pteronyssinus TaxID=6956 RepID=A0A6P6Y9U7_DERPT|nr:ATP-dependent DNA helicase Q-like 4B [Dermatophagoides pteronyssinus]
MYLEDLVAPEKIYDINETPELKNWFSLIRSIEQPFNRDLNNPTTLKANLSFASNEISSSVSDTVIPKPSDVQSTMSRSGSESNSSKSGIEINHSDFRSQQLNAIKSLLQNNDTICIMPTGGGKSLIYQVFAIYSKKVVIVIMPLISLIEDQLRQSLKYNINAIVYRSKAELMQVFDENRELVIFTTPEKLASSDTLKYFLTRFIEQNCIAAFVIDEAHCVSTWGSTFRPEYRLLRERLQSTTIPKLCLTASATTEVLADIRSQLGLKNPREFISSIWRENIHISVVSVKNDAEILEVVSNLLRGRYYNKVGIIYCLSRTDCDTMVKKLQALKIKALSYHAGMTVTKRKTTQAAWIKEEIKIIVATIAFGMGIDKQNVRFVIHTSLPKSLDSYYQEFGRAGRDGEKSEAILYYNEKDRVGHYWLEFYSNGKSTTTTAIFPSKNLQHVLEYVVNNRTCRHRMISNYFGDSLGNRDCMTNCDDLIAERVVKGFKKTLLVYLCRGKNLYQKELLSNLQIHVANDLDQTGETEVLESDQYEYEVKFNRNFENQIF